ncbi:MAG TPA: HAMP domain-containing protein, partial [Actinomycetota bacterium]|nr:HAMP domain-containing protein [Actinomycetota bacterium]
MTVQRRRGHDHVSPPAVAHQRRSDRPSIGFVWNSTLIMLVTVVLVLGTGVYVSTQYQRTAFDETTTQFEQQIRSAVDLSRAMRTSDVMISTIFYQFGSPEDFERSLRQFETRAQDVDVLLARARQVFPATSLPSVESAQREWDKLHAGVIAAPRFWGTQEVQKGLEAGKDIFIDEWDALGNAQEHMIDATAEAVAALKARRDEVNQVQDLVPPFVLAAIFITLGIGAWSVRRLSRRIVAPVVALRDVAMRLRQGDLSARTAVGRATLELQELGDTMNDMAG